MTGKGTKAPDRGPACENCGCAAVEHQHLVNEAWLLVPGRCLTCDCPAFVAGAQTVAGFVYDEEGG